MNHSNIQGATIVAMLFGVFVGFSVCYGWQVRPILEENQIIIDKVRAGAPVLVITPSGSEPVAYARQNFKGTLLKSATYGAMGYGQVTCLFYSDGSVAQ